MTNLNDCELTIDDLEVASGGFSLASFAELVGVKTAPIFVVTGKDAKGNLTGQWFSQ
jgi:hypothetical protein